MPVTVYEPLLKCALALRDPSELTVKKISPLILEMSLLPLEFIENEIRLVDLQIRIALKLNKDLTPLHVIRSIYQCTIQYKTKHTDLEYLSLKVLGNV